MNLFYGGASVEFTQLINDLISGSKAGRFYPIRDFMVQKQEEKGGENDSPDEAGLTRPRPAVSFQNVSFSYDKFPVLEDISLNIEPGEKVAFVGGSGSGKSTIMKLLLRFYQPDKGKIRIVGTAAETYSLKGLRGLFAYVPQQPELYSGTVRDNLLFARPDAKDRDILEAPILVFDEATAALDGETESVITAALSNARPEQTLLLVTHRLSTALLADRIVVLDYGPLVEMGTHEQLLEKEGYYAGLWAVR